MNISLPLIGWISFGGDMERLGAFLLLWVGVSHAISLDSEENPQAVLAGALGWSVPKQNTVDEDKYGQYNTKDNGDYYGYEYEEYEDGVPGKQGDSDLVPEPFLRDLINLQAQRNNKVGKLNIRLVE